MPSRLPDTRQRYIENLYCEASLGAWSAAAGVAAPATQTFLGVTRIRTVNPTTQDGLDFALVLPKSQEIDVATVTVTPTVRWTCIDTPSANATLVWKLDYSYAMPALVPDTTGGASSYFVDVRTATTSVRTLTGTEYRQHLVTAFPAWSWPAALAVPGLAVIGHLRVSSASTVADSLVAPLSVGLAFMSGPSGCSSVLP